MKCYLHSLVEVSIARIHAVYPRRHNFSSNRGACLTMRRNIMKSTVAVALAVMSASALSGQDASPNLGPMKSTRVFGQTIRYYDIGSGTGPVLVLIHGAPSNALLTWG